VCYRFARLEIMLIRNDTMYRAAPNTDFTTQPNMNIHVANSTLSRGGIRMRKQSMRVTKHVPLL